MLLCRALLYCRSIGGPAAILAQNCIKKVEVEEYPELGMEAVWKIQVRDCCDIWLGCCLLVWSHQKHRFNFRWRTSPRS
jgi:hypothetical protein